MIGLNALGAVLLLFALVVFAVECIVVKAQGYWPPIKFWRSG